MPPFISLTYALFVLFVFGAVVGSFLNVCIVRLPKGESLVSPPSHCPHCKTPIPFYDNIPLISYVWLVGRCRFCPARISPRYFVVELLMALLAAALWLRFGFGIVLVVGFVFVAALVVISFIDLDVRIVPDIISLPGIGAGLIVSIVNSQWSAVQSSLLPSPLSSFLGILFGGGILLFVAWGYQFLTGKEGMGGGDVKLLAMIGAFLGWPSVPVTLFLASLSGSAVGIALMASRGVNMKYALPFAPFLCLGAVLHLFFGKQIIAFYFQLN
ncbi:MAG: prepilin peptidase [Deltaproteobacteria bacterium]|nr:prepilin peptidase [Deltaproteobacteria bacterium]